MPTPDNPQTRQEMYLNAMATGDSSGIPETPQTREEMYLDAIVKNGSGGGGEGGGGILITVDMTSEQDPQPADKTCGEVMSAINSNLPIYFKFAYGEGDYSIGSLQELVYYADATGISQEDPVYKFCATVGSTLWADTLNDTLTVGGGK